MDGGTIQQALLMILNVIIAALVGALTALSASYFRTRGQNLATKHDFVELLNQLKTNTELVETIKSEFSQRDWAQREWTNLRRIKLEALLEKMHDCETYLDQYRDYSMDHTLKAAGPERNPTNELQTITELYLPELRREVFVLCTAFRNQVRVGMNLRLEWLKMARDMEEADKPAFHEKAIDEYRNAMTAEFIEQTSRRRGGRLPCLRLSPRTGADRKTVDGRRAVERVTSGRNLANAARAAIFYAKPVSCKLSTRNRSRAAPS
jgi:hypothetical protein